jgi:hypothetical protein
MRLWRGDQVSKLHVGDFRTEGIVSKQLLRGDPDYVSRTGLWRAAQAHVAPLFSREKVFYEKSSFLSFSASRDVALTYASGPRKVKLVSTGQGQLSTQHAQSRIKRSYSSRRRFSTIWREAVDLLSVYPPTPRLPPSLKFRWTSRRTGKCRPSTLVLSNRESNWAGSLHCAFGGCSHDTWQCHVSPPSRARPTCRYLVVLGIWRFTVLLCS